MKKKLIVIPIVLAALLIGVFAFTTYRKNRAVTEEIEHKLLSDWFDYLFVNEKYNGDTLWTISYVERFLDAPTWENLNFARMSLSVASSYVEARDKPEPSMTQEDYNFLIKQGQDVSFLTVEIDSVEMTRNALTNFLEELSLEMYDGVFWKPSFETLKQELPVQRALAEKDLQYLASTTDYLLLTMKTKTEIEKFRTFVKENCPLIAAYQDPSETDREVVYQKATVVLNEIEELEEDVTETIGFRNAQLMDYQDAAESGDWSVLTRNPTQMEGLPLLLPAPGWGTVSSVYYWKNADDSVSIPNEGDALSRLPDRCLFTYKEATEEEFLTYISFLDAIGISAISVNETEDSRSALYHLGDSTILISLDSDGATIAMRENPLCLAPLWYVYASLDSGG